MSRSSYRFGHFHLDRSAYRLTRNDAVVELTPKLLDVLFQLAARAGTLVTKEELLDAVWPDANVTDNALAQAISDLRDALDDDPAAPRFIKTVARRGYRFVAAIEEVRGKEEAPRGGAAAGEAVAVMDFANLSGDTESAWLSNGIAETVTSDLRALGRFRIVDRRLVIEAARATDGSLQAVTRALDAGLAVVGGFQRNKQRLRITARLVDAANGDALADAKVDGDVADIFALQDQVVAQLSAELGISPSTSRTATEGRDTASLEAFRAFTEGWLRLETLDVRELPKAVEELQRAVKIDPQYALAYAGLASAELALHESKRFDNVPPREALQSAIEHARHAVSLAPSLAEARATLALVLVSAGEMTEAALSAQAAVSLEPANWRHWFRLGHSSWGEARLRAAGRTLALYPEFAFAHFQMAMVFVARGDLREAETILRHGAAVQDRQIGRGGRYPALGLHWLLGLVRLEQDDTEEAIDEFEQEEEAAHSYRLYGAEYLLHARYSRGAALLRAGRHADAIRALELALEAGPAHGESLLMLASACTATGDVRTAATLRSRAEQALQLMEGGRPADAAILRAQLLASAGDPQGASAMLTRLLGSAPPGFLGWTIPVDPLFHGLAKTPEFKGVLATLSARAR